MKLLAIAKTLPVYFKHRLIQSEVATYFKMKFLEGWEYTLHVVYLLLM